MLALEKGWLVLLHWPLWVSLIFCTNSWPFHLIDLSEIIYIYVYVMYIIIIIYILYYMYIAIQYNSKKVIVDEEIT